MKRIIITIATVLFAVLSLSGKGGTSPDQNKIYRVVISDFKDNDHAMDKSALVSFKKNFRKAIREKGFVVIKDSEIKKRTAGQLKIDIKPDVVGRRTQRHTKKNVLPGHSISGQIYKLGDGIAISVRMTEYETGKLTAYTSIYWNLSRKGGLRNTAERLAESLINQIGKQTASGAIHLEVEPRDALVKFVGEPNLYKSPVVRTIAPGKHVFIVEPTNASTHKRIRKGFVIMPGKRNHLKVKLKIQEGTLLFGNKFKEAVTYLDGKYIRVTSGQELQVAASKSYDLTVLTRSGRFYRQPFFVQPDSKIPVDMKPNLEDLFAESGKHLVFKSNINRDITHVKPSGDKIFVYYTYEDRGYLTAVNAYSLQRQWTFTDYNVIKPPISVGDRLFVFCRYVWRDSYGFTSVYYKLVELDPATGNIIRGEKQNYNYEGKAKYNENNQFFFVFENGRILFLRPDVDEPMRIKVKAKTHRKLDWEKCGISGLNLLILDRASKTLHSFSLSPETPKRLGMLNWEYKFDTTVHDLILTGGIPIVTTDDGRVVFFDANSGKVNFEEKINLMDVRAFQYSNGIIYVFFKNGAYWKVSAVSPVTWKVDKDVLRDLYPPLLTDCKVDRFGQFIFVAGGHRVVLYDPEFDHPIWIYELQHRVKDLALTDSFISIATGSGELLTFAHSKHSFLMGLIEDTDHKKGTIKIRAFRDLDKVGDVLFASHINNLLEPDQPNMEEFEYLYLNGIISRKGRVFEAKVPKIPQRIKPGYVLMQPAVIEVKADQPGSAVWLDGSFAGRTPSRFIGIKPGTHDIKVFHPGKQMLYSKFQVKEGLENSFSVNIPNRKNINFKIETIPAGASVYIDNVFKGHSPFIHKAIPGKTITVQLKKPGYKTIKERIQIKQDGASKKYVLSFNSRFVGFYGTWTQFDSSPIIGWGESSITTNGVIGNPVRLQMGNMPGIRFSFGYDRGKTAFSFQSNLFFQHERDDDNVLVFLNLGARTLFMRSRYIGEISIGLSFKYDSLSFSNTEPSWEQAAQGELPQEYWSHLIPNVFIENSGTMYICGLLSWRPVWWSFIEFKVGKPIGGILSGTAIVTDEYGHIFKDESRSYEMQAESGHFWGVDIDLLLYKLTPKSLRWSMPFTLHLSYHDAKIDYGAAIERERSLLVGFGITFFLN